MPQLAHFALLVLAFVCFALSAFPVASPHWNRLVSVGWAALTASMINW